MVIPIRPGDTVGCNRVLGREGTTGAPRYRTLWRVLCDQSLGGCGAVRLMRADNLRRGDAACPSCAVLTSPARRAVLSSHAGTLTQPIWLRVCVTCGEAFRGTARQVYCSKACRPRPSPVRKKRGQKAKAPPETKGHVRRHPHRPL